MSQIVKILRGIPGSGKSTHAFIWLKKDPQNRARVNRDALRYENFGAYVLPPELEKVITKLQLTQFETLLKMGKSVIVDDTNLRNKNIIPFLEIAAKFNVPVIYEDIEVDLKLALERNSKRERVVPETVIKKMYNSYIHRDAFPTLVNTSAFFAPYIPDEAKPSAILLDLDGTAAHMSSERGPFDWHKVLLDEPNFPVLETVEALANAGHKVIAVSGRDRICYDDTLLWLENFGINPDALFMRPEEDYRPDWQIKGEIFNNHIRDNYNVILCLDDRDQVVDFYRNTLKLTVFQVAYGNF